MQKPHSTKRATLQDVAAHAGVSVATVSRVLHHPDKVSVAVRNNVQAAIRQLAYVPNSAARALVTNSSNVLGVLVPSVTNQVFAEVLRGIYATVADTAFQVQLGNTHYSPLTEEALLRVFLSQRPAGLLVAGMDQSSACRELLKQAQCPVVQFMELSAAEPLDYAIGFSHQQAATEITEHLLAQGYQRIAFLGARMDPRSQRRLKGYQQVLQAYNAYHEHLVVTTPKPSNAVLGGELLSELLSREPQADAVFCNNDILALGVLFECQRRRINVPEKMGISGFYGEKIMLATHPSLTSLETQRYQIGQQAVQIVLDVINNKPPADKVVDVGYALAGRESTLKG